MYAFRGQEGLTTVFSQSKGAEQDALGTARGRARGGYVGRDLVLHAVAVAEAMSGGTSYCTRSRSRRLCREGLGTARGRGCYVGKDLVLHGVGAATWKRNRIQKLDKLYTVTSRHGSCRLRAPTTGCPDLYFGSSSWSCIAAFYIRMLMATIIYILKNKL